jgi:hypothetical protein
VPIVRVLPLNSVETAARDPRARSRVTNSLRESLVGVDGRTERARRYRDLLEGCLAEFGPGEPDKLRALAAMKLSLEATQAAVINGDVLRSEDLVRLANVISRREQELRARARRHQVAQTGAVDGLRGRLSSRYGKGGAP